MRLEKNRRGARGEISPAIGRDKIRSGLRKRSSNLQQTTRQKVVPNRQRHENRRRCLGRADFLALDRLAGLVGIGSGFGPPRQADPEDETDKDSGHHRKLPESLTTHRLLTHFRAPSPLPNMTGTLADPPQRFTGLLV